jgi:hypothetical protein
MTADDHCNIFVLADKLFPNILAAVERTDVGVRRCVVIRVKRGAVGIEISVSENDRAMIWMRVEKLPRPSENIVGRAKVKGDDKIIYLSDREGMISVANRILVKEAAVFFD